MKYYLVTYQQRWYERPDWQMGNDVTTDPGMWFVGLKERNDEKASSVFLSAVAITKTAYNKLKEEL